MSESLQKVIVVGTLFVGYLLLVANRKSFQYVIPYVSKEAWISKTDIGFIISSQTFGYTISKFLGGLAADHVDNRVMLLTSILLSSLITQVFVFSHNVLASAFLWFLSGCIQGVSWPAIAQIIRHTVPPDCFGTCWVIISCAMNIASMIVPIVSAYISEYYHWTYSLCCISAVTFVFFFVVLFVLLRVEKVKKATKGAGNEDAKVSWYSIFMNPIQMSICIGFFGVTILRFTATDWMPFYLTTEVGMSEIYASSFISILETGGICGSLIAAQISDRCIRNYGSEYKNPRFPCIIVCTMIAANATFLIAWEVDASRMTLVSILAFILGFSIYGPVALYGMTSMESAPEHIASSCHTMAALSANIGSVVAGYPISALSNLIGWSYTFSVIVVILSFTGILLYFVRNCDPLKKSVKRD